MRGDGLRWTYHVAVHNSELRGNGIDGLRLAQTHFASVAGTTSAANGQHGLSVEGARATLLSENAFAGNGGLSGRGCGVMVQSVDELHPRALYAWGNNMTGAPRAGVCIKAGYDINLNRTRIVNTRDRKATCFDAEHQSFGETNGVCSVLSKKEYRVYPLKMKPRCPGRGIMSGKVCCERTCRKCGGKGCQRRGPNSSCCYSTVQKMNRPCKKFSPPCVM